jgi:hypothetical protein
MAHGDYTLEDWKDIGIAILRHPEYGRQIWVPSRMRKPHTCAVTGEVIAKGSRAFRPITNGYNRMQRISEQGIEHLGIVAKGGW